MNFLYNYFNLSRKLRKNLIFPPKIVEKPIGSRILVLSPHFDDEILGCGGALKKHILAGDDVLVIYLTDGSQGIPSIKDKEEVFKIRSKESEKATNLLGIIKRIYLNDSECDKRIRKFSLNKLTHIIKSFKPDLIYLPSIFDDHIDHIKINKMLKIIFLKHHFPCNICAYEIWTPLIPNIIVDITKVMKDKKKAMSFFKSQIEQVNYNRIIEGLNTYRTAYNMKGKGHAEAFLYLPIKKYISLIP